MIKHHSKIIAIIAILFVGYVYGSQYYGSLVGKKYFKEFLTDQFEKVEIKIINCFSAEEPVIFEITEQEEIKFFRDMLENQLREGYIKEKKLYYYSVRLKFFNKRNTNTYFYEIFLDKKNIALRPVILREKGQNSWPGGFSFILDDSNFIFYNKVLQMIVLIDQNTMERIINHSTFALEWICYKSINAKVNC